MNTTRTSAKCIQSPNSYKSKTRRRTEREKKSPVSVANRRCNGLGSWPELPPCSSASNDDGEESRAEWTSWCRRRWRRRRWRIPSGQRLRLATRWSDMTMPRLFCSVRKTDRAATDVIPSNVTADGATRCWPNQNTEELHKSRRKNHRSPPQPQLRTVLFDSRT